MAELVGELAGHAARSGDEVTVVLDSKPFEIAAEGVDVRFAPGPGPDAADDVIVDIVAADAEPSSLLVATSDRRLVGPRADAWRGHDRRRHFAAHRRRRSLTG